MGEYQRTIKIKAEAGKVFDFVSDINNLPRYLPTVREAKPQGDERIIVEGEAAGHPYHNDGNFHVDHGARRMEWSSDGENDYRGWLEVKDGTEAATSEVTVHLAFNPRPELARKFAEQQTNRDQAIEQGIEKALFSIQHNCEGTGQSG